MPRTGDRFFLSKRRTPSLCTKKVSVLLSALRNRSFPQDSPPGFFLFSMTHRSGHVYCLRLPPPFFPQRLVQYSPTTWRKGRIFFLANRGDRPGFGPPTAGSILSFLPVAMRSLSSENRTPSSGRERSGSFFLERQFVFHATVRIRS